MLTELYVPLSNKVILPNGIHIWWDGYARLYIDVQATFHGKEFGGLCGDFNGNQKDDFRTVEGSIEQDAYAFANRYTSDLKTFFLWMCLRL